MCCFPSWHHGIPVVAHRARKFDPEEAFHLIAKYGIRNAFMPPTALKLMRQVKDPKSRHNYNMRSIGSGGETLGEELLDWGREVMGLTINEFYGQTECNLIVGCCAEIMEIRPGSMGRAIPGHMVDVIDEQGQSGHRGHRRRNCRQTSRSGHVSGILAKPGCHPQKIYRRLALDRRSGQKRRQTAISGSTAARTM